MITRSYPSAAVRAQDAAYGTPTQEPLRPVHMVILVLIVIIGLCAGLPFLGKVMANTVDYQVNYEENRW